MIYFIESNIECIVNLASLVLHTIGDISSNKKTNKRQNLSLGTSADKLMLKSLKYSVEQFPTQVPTYFNVA